MYRSRHCLAERWVFICVAKEDQLILAKLGALATRLDNCSSSSGLHRRVVRRVLLLLIDVVVVDAEWKAEEEGVVV